MVRVQVKKPTPLQTGAEPQGKPANLFPRPLGGRSDPGILRGGAGESPNQPLPQAKQKVGERGGACSLQGAANDGRGVEAAEHTSPRTSTPAWAARQPSSGDRQFVTTASRLGANLPAGLFPPSSVNPSEAKPRSCFSSVSLPLFPRRTSLRRLPAAPPPGRGALPQPQHLATNT